MKCLVLAAVISTACGGSSAPGGPRPLVFERWSPAQPSSYDVFVAAQGSVVVMANRISRDGGATWSALDPRVGQLGHVAIDGSVVSLYAPGLGLARWDVASDQITPVADAPAFVSDRTWRRDPATRRFLAFAPVDNAVAVERTSGWATAALPRPAPTECCPYILDLESNGATMLTVSGWGVHRSTDGGATWQPVAAGLPGAGRDLLVLGDGRFVLAGGATSYAFSPAGEAAGAIATLAVGNDEATVCDDGSIVAAGKVTRDLGATWRPLATAGAVDLVTERAGCGAGSYWVLVRSAAWGYRLLRYAAPGAPGIAAGNWDATGMQAWADGGPALVRSDDGTFLAGGLAWRAGAAAWTLGEMPAQTWSAGGVLFGVGGGRFYASSDAGASWTTVTAAGLGATEPDAFARTPDGALYLGQYTGESSATTDAWHAGIWRSADTGASWSPVYSGVATRPAGKDVVGEAHHFVGIAGDGTWVATDAVSRDAGATWQPTETSGDHSVARLRSDGSLVLESADASGNLWRVYGDGGAGDLLAVQDIEADGQRMLAVDLRSVAFDDAGYAYVARGTPHVQIWRSTTPL